MRPTIGTLGRILIIAVVTLSVFAAGATSAVADPQPSPSPSPSVSPPPGEPPLWDIPGRVQYGINSWFRDLLASAIDPIFQLLGQTVLSTPHLEDHPRVRDLWRFSLGVADGVLVLFVLAGSGIVMTGGLASQITMKELLPRLLLAAGAANLGLLLAGQLISFCNALTMAFLGTTVSPQDITIGLSELLFGVGLGNPLFLIFALVILIFAVLVLVAYVVRVAVLVVLLAGGPLLLITHCLPQTEYIARVWWRLLIAMIAAPVAQSILLVATARVFLTGDGVLGLASGGSLIDLLVIGCLLYVLFRIPMWTIHMALQGAGSRAWSAAKQKTVTTVKAVIAA